MNNTQDITYYENYINNLIEHNNKLREENDLIYTKYKNLKRNKSRLRKKLNDIITKLNNELEKTKITKNDDEEWITL